MKTIALVLLAAAVAATAAFVSLDARRGDDGVAVLEIRGDDARLELIPVDVDGGAAGPESVAFDGDGGGPYTGVSDGRVLRWLPAERRWVDHSSSCASEISRPVTKSMEEARVV
ncbi:unnamed protein product [Urochloa decumbens]|uniref:Uncharacterized protein n=1 Tax=Urochloa decumbens TaxID=240449 RepID=A0ABC9BA14_9POAL